MATASKSGSARRPRPEPVHRVAGSFGWPFHAPLTRWIVGCLCVLLLPLLFVPLLGYAVAATRSAEPPPWTISSRLLSDGFWTALAIALTALPFAIAAWLLQPLRDGVIGATVTLFALLLVWGLLALLLLPHATASFAASGDPHDLFNFAASIRGVRADFATWNVVVAAMVTAWAVGIACVGLVCIGIVPGTFYAILVSAHAAAALKGEGQGPRLSAR